MLLGRNLEERRERVLVPVDRRAYPLRDLLSASLPIPVEQLTCWLMSRIAMSLRSSVYSWNAASMADVCVSACQRVRRRQHWPRPHRTLLAPPSGPTQLWGGYTTSTPTPTLIPTRLDDQEVLLLLVVDVPDAREEEARHRVLLSAKPALLAPGPTSSPITASRLRPFGFDVAGALMVDEPGG